MTGDKGGKMPKGGMYHANEGDFNIDCPRLAAEGVIPYLSINRNDNLKLTHRDNPILTPLKFN